MNKHGYEWAKELSCGVVVCDKQANILYINDVSAHNFASFGDNLTEHSLYEFHGERARDMIKKMLADGSTNSYTIEKNGIHKLIVQMAWYSDGQIAGLVELSMVVPGVLPHYIR